MSAHAKLGASGAHRWLACPGSINLAAQLPPGVGDQPNFAACQGTAAHTLGEWCLRNRAGTDDYPDDTILVPEWPHYAFPVRGEMSEAVEVYLEFVANEIERLGGIDAVDLGVEIKGKPLPDRNDMFGTADLVITQAFGELVVADYKHGNTIVEPDLNPQAMFYGLTALQKVGPSNIETVKLVIVQPRPYHPKGPVRHWYTTPEALLEFGSQLAAGADLTREADAPLVPGDHCHFCPAEGVCPAQRKDDLALLGMTPANFEIVEPPATPCDPSEVERMLGIIPRWDSFVRSVQGKAMQMAMAGHQFDGLKLVRKRANRRIINEDKAVSTILDEIGDDNQEHFEDLYEPAARKSPSQLEKVLTRHKIKPARRKEIMEPLVERPDGGLTLASRDDARDEVQVTSDVDMLPAGDDK